MAIKLKNIGYPWIVHGFALVHALVSYGSRSAGLDDTLFLTFLTMAMTVIICIKQNLRVESAAVNIIFVNILGFALGIGAARFFGLFMGSETLISACSTLLTTEALGWGLVFFGRLYAVPSEKVTYSSNDSQVFWLTAAVLFVFILRIVVNGLMSTSLFKELPFGDTFRLFFSNTVAMMVMLFSTILFILYVRRSDWYRESSGERVWWLISSHLLFFMMVTALSSIIVGFGMPITAEGEFSTKYFMLLMMVAIVLELAIYSLVYIIYYAISAQRLAATERNKANEALVQYMSLKQQVNPHFLFNSLNILDCIVAEEKTTEARDYIRKLSGMYRYMLKSENQPVSLLSDEMEYVKMYCDLLLVRFPEGLEIENDIDPSLLGKMVVTYSVQMLVENAVKHNTISSGNPLVIKIFTDEDCITVTNNLSPRLSPAESTGLGLKYIKNIYKDRSGKDVVIQEDDKTYRVSLPLL